MKRREFGRAGISSQHHFRIIANLIFGTQLAFLAELAQREPIERQDVKCLEQGMTTNSFDECAGYLITSKLIEADQGAYTLPDLGREFILRFAPAKSLNMKTRIL